LYVQWPGEPDLRAGALKLLTAYRSNAAHIVADAEHFLGALSKALGVPEMAVAPGTPPPDTRELVEAKLRHWTESLTPAAAVNCLASLAEAAGRAEEAFQLLHEFWKDVLPGDREGPDFERYRFHHGRLGVGNGIISIVGGLSTDRGMESLQNLLRIRHFEPRACAWAGTAFVRAGRIDLAGPLLNDAQESFNASVAAETSADAWLAVAEALFCMAQPEGVFETWEDTALRARQAGDLPRQAEVIAVTALFHAEFAQDLYPGFLNQQAEPVLAQAKRLNAPTIDGFIALAHGRYLTKTFAGAVAQAPLKSALQHLRAAGRPPWLIYAMIECAKALLDEQTWEKADEAAKLLAEVEPLVGRHPIWLPWLYEARGQGYLCVRKAQEAVSEFALAVSYAEELGLTGKADSLRPFAQFGGSPTTEREQDE
jgi:tetratricopeptide (TPR) repeat protein